MRPGDRLLRALVNPLERGVPSAAWPFHALIVLGVERLWHSNRFMFGAVHMITRAGDHKTALGKVVLV